MKNNYSGQRYRVFTSLRGYDNFVLTAKFFISISKLVAPPLDEVVRHGGVRGGCRSSQCFVARHALRSRTHHGYFKVPPRLLFHCHKIQNTNTINNHKTPRLNFLPM